ncbi:MAG: hypothetical protein Q4D38_14110 [Planctomycetia bacterium]|nr:hypothetical protein [Planctomycetia bacterium]
MSEFGKKAVPGQKNLRAGAYNRIIAKLGQLDVQPPDVVNQPRDTNLVRLENETGSALSPFGVVKTDAATWAERYDETFEREGMRRGVEIQGAEVATEWDNVAVLQKSAPADHIAQAVVSGPTPCYIEFPDEASLDFPFAIPIPGNVQKMKASPFGRNRILWHAEPEESIEACQGVTLQAYVNMGEDGQWVWFKLLADLCPCGSAQALLVDECGKQIGECPIVKTVWAPLPHDEEAAPACDCPEGATSANIDVGGGEGTEGSDCWKEGDILPFWWYQYLEKWVTIPKDQTGAGSAWAVTIPQPPSIACEAVEVVEVNDAGGEERKIVCEAALVIPRKKLTVQNGCACLADEQPLAVALPTPEVVSRLDFAIETGDATGTEDDPCTCAKATLEVTTKPIDWCEGCQSDERTQRFSFPVPPENGGTFEALLDMSVRKSDTCGAVEVCTSRRGYSLVCGGLCAEDMIETTCETVPLFENDELEYVSDVTLENLQVSLDTTAAEVVTDATYTPPTATLETETVSVLTDASVTISPQNVAVSYDRATGLDWSGVSWSVEIPTVEKTVVTGISVDGCNINVTTETIRVVDPSLACVVTMNNAPTLSTSSATTTVRIVPDVTFTPTERLLAIPTAVRLSTGGVTLQKESITTAGSGTISGGTVQTQKTKKRVLVCE